jgi:hypothetical protein
MGGRTHPTSKDWPDVPTAQAPLRHARPSTTLDVSTRLQGDAATRMARMRKALDA